MLLCRLTSSSWVCSAFSNMIPMKLSIGPPFIASPVRASHFGVLCCHCQDTGHIRYFSSTGSLLKNLTSGRSPELTQTPAEIFQVAHIPSIKQKTLPLGTSMKMMCFLTCADHRHLTSEDIMARCGIVSAEALLGWLGTYICWGHVTHTHFGSSTMMLYHFKKGITSPIYQYQYTDGKHWHCESLTFLIFNYVYAYISEYGYTHMSTGT